MAFEDGENRRKQVSQEQQVLVVREATTGVSRRWKAVGNIGNGKLFECTVATVKFIKLL
jgi:hypothetical protein